MASDNHDERVRGALVVVLLRQDIEDTVYIKTTEGKKARTAVVPMPSALVKFTHDRVFSQAWWSSIMLRKAEMKRRDSRKARNFRKTLPHPVRVLLGALCRAGKAPKVVLVGCKGRGREAVYVHLWS